MSRTPFLHPILFLIFTILISGCGSNHETMARMDRADSIMETAPDSALCILDSINPGTLASKKEKARYALLKSMAYDKNYIDTTSFDVIQPAIDYYLYKGNPNEKLRTLFYQGRIYQNRNEDEEAMKCFIKAIELKDEITDSMVLARTYNAQGFLYKNQGLYESYISNSLNSFNIYKNFHLKDLEMDCLTSAINGAIFSNNRAKADSVLGLADSIAATMDHTDSHYLHCKIIYSIDYGDESRTRTFLDTIGENATDLVILLDLAYAYDRLHDSETALKFLSLAMNDSISSDFRMKFYSIKANIHESLGQYNEALATFKIFINIRDSINSNVFSQEIQSVEKRYNLEKEVTQEKQTKTIIILTAILIALLLLILLTLVLIRLRDIKIRQLTLEDEKQRIELEREYISSQLSDQKILNASLRSVMKERLDILNGLLAYQITSNEKYAKGYLQLKEDLSNNKTRFLKTLRDSIGSQNPEFMKYLNDCGLTEVEVNYVCLYAIGLRGKEIGTYLETKRHYIISSEIRNKLGLDPNDTNLGTYILSKLEDFPKE